MGARGPAPTPIRILEARGSTVPGRRGSGVEMEPGAPVCPAQLSAAAKLIWRRCVKHLTWAGILCKADEGALAAYCVRLARAWEITAAIEAKGKKKFKGEPEYKLLRVEASAWQDVARLAAQFGFSPSARARIEAPAVQKPRIIDMRDRAANE